MIGENEFKELIQEYIQQDQRITALEEVFPGCFESLIVEYGFKLFDKIIDLYFNKDGIDWIYYYLLENPENCYYQDDKRIPLENVNDLWNLVKDYRI